MAFDVCPICGHKEVVTRDVLKNAMNRYVDAESGEVIGVFNDDVKEMAPKGRKLLREDVFKQLVAEKKLAVKPTAPTAPAK